MPTRIRASREPTAKRSTLDFYSAGKGARVSALPLPALSFCSGLQGVRLRLGGAG